MVELYDKERHEELAPRTLWGQQEIGWLMEYAAMLLVDDKPDMAREVSPEVKAARNAIEKRMSVRAKDIEGLAWMALQACGDCAGGVDIKNAGYKNLWSMAGKIERRAGKKDGPDLRPLSDLYRMQLRVREGYSKGECEDERALLRVLHGMRLWLHMSGRFHGRKTISRLGNQQSDENFRGGLKADSVAVVHDNKLGRVAVFIEIQALTPGQVASYEETHGAYEDQRGSGLQSVFWPSVAEWKRQSRTPLDLALALSYDEC